MAFPPPQRRHQPLTPVTPSTPPSLPTFQEPMAPLLPMTPPDVERAMNLQADAESVSTVLHVMSTESAAVQHIVHLYRNNVDVQRNLAYAIRQIVDTIRNHGKLVICAMGKSGKIGDKTVATMRSLGIECSFLNAAEAAHGDLGMLRPHDILMLMTFSGATHEIISLLKHVPATTTLIALTDHMSISSCPLFAARQHCDNILLPTQIHESERESFGLAAPTSSTTVTLVLADGLALALGSRLHNIPGRGPAEVFKGNHPGGAIGIATVQETSTVLQMSQIATMVDTIPIAIPRPGQPLRAMEIVRTAVRSPGGWVRRDASHMIAPRRTQAFEDMEQTVDMMDAEGGPPRIERIIVEKKDWISVGGDWSVEGARDWVSEMLAQGHGRTFLKAGTILGIVDKKGEVSGVVEIEEVVGERFELIGGLAEVAFGEDAGEMDVEESRRH